MNVLILSDEPCEGLERTLAYIEKTDKTIKVQRKRASQWLPGPMDDKVVVVHVGVPCRLALPFGYNVLAVGGPYPEAWGWMEQGMDLVLHNHDIETSLPHLPTGKTFRESIEIWRQVIRQAKFVQKPPVQTPTGKVSIVTITHNRVPWWPNMVQNVLSQSWPQKDIEWIIVDDGQALLGQVDQLQRDYPDLTVKYLCQEPNDIGAKRNAGVKAATSDIVVFMDDDDHYPKESVYNRVKALQKTDCVYCATLPIYDIRYYESSMLGPTVQKLPYQRASVASLAFRKSFWATRPFSDGDNDAEFLKERELETVELSPKDVIVAFLHKGNPKARFGSDEKPQGEPNGCHYGFSEKYFTYLHQIGMDS
jgi:hypothetical protein